MPSQRNQQDALKPVESVEWKVVFSQDPEGLIRVTFASTLTGATRVMRTNPGEVIWGLPDTSRKLTALVTGALYKELFSVAEAAWEPF